MKPDTESWLREYYRPHNRALGEFLGWRTTWDNHAHSGGVSCNAAI
jgi:hypothetical protein